MTISQLRRRIDALKRKLARELAIIQLRRIADSVADAWNPDDPPGARRRHPARRQGRLSGSPPSDASATASATPVARATRPTPNPSFVACSPGPKTTATTNSSAATFPPRPRNDDRCPNRVCVRGDVGKV